MKWMDSAWADLGVTETPGPKATDAIVAYFRDVGSPVTSDEIAWCAAYAGAHLARAGVPLDAIAPEERLLARAYLRIGTAIKELRVGALCVTKRGEPWQGHVGFVTGWTDTHVMLLGGNQGNAVSVRNYPRADIVGLRWPVLHRAPDELARDGSRIATAAQRQKGDLAKTGVVAAPSTVTPAEPPSWGLDAIVQDAGIIKTTLQTIESFSAFAVSKWPWIAGGIAAYFLGRMAWDAMTIAQARAEDANTGRTT